MDINNVAVIGAGTMGAGIAQICAQRGWNTRLFDTYESSLKNAIININTFWNKGVSLGKNNKEQVNKWSKNLEIYTDISKAIFAADLVIEAVPEKMSLKKEIFLK